MKYFYLYVFILCVFIFIMSSWTTYAHSYYEPFVTTNNKQTFILLGDSIFKNDAYISTNEKSVEELITEKTEQKIIGLAKDHSSIDDIYEQFENIPEKLNKPSTTIFISAGGNDILSYFVDKGNDITNTDYLNVIFSSYKKLIDSIRVKLPDTKIILLDIYYPNTLQYKKYSPLLVEWNKLIYKYVENNKNNITQVLKISGILTQPDDFTRGVEPSASGGKKLADALLDM